MGPMVTMALAMSFRSASPREGKSSASYIIAAERLHGDDATVPVSARGKTAIARFWVYVRDDRPFGGPAPRASVFYYSHDRRGEHPQGHLKGYGRILQADAYGGYGKLHEPDRAPGPIPRPHVGRTHAAHFFVLADIAGNARRKASSILSPLCLATVRRVDAVFAIERDMNGRSIKEHRATRKQSCLPLVADLHVWLIEQRRARPAASPPPVSIQAPA